MRFVSARTAAIGLTAVAALVVPLTGPAHAAAPATSVAAAATCDGKSPSSAPSPTTKRTTTVHSRVIELRYSAKLRCAWGRISNGSVGDEIWVDRSSDGGKTWESKLGRRTISSGRDAHTTMWSDAGKLMRACGKAGDRSEIACTGWY
jgi:hypothetical protein